jgi:hypothetical protein
MALVIAELMMADVSGESAKFTAEELGKWVAILLFVTGGGLGIRKLLQKPVPVRDPLTVQDISPPATKDELAEVKEDIDARLVKIELAMDEQRRVARESQSNVHRRIDTVATTLAEVKGELTQINSNVRTLLERSLNKPTGR